MSAHHSPIAPASRRDFIKQAGTAAAVASVAFPYVARGQGDNAQLKVGLIGCGGRGTGAAANALGADDNVVLHAVGDAFADKAQGAVNQLKNNFAGRADVPAERQFAGLDAYQKVLDSGIDVVILATPPGFRPVQLAAAVEKNVHIFCEKPMAVDAPGVRSVMESVRKSKENGKALVAGFCWRYDYARREAFKRLMDGEIGDITSIYATYYTGPVKPMPPADAKPDGMSQTEWMVRNWYNFSWLGGDGLVEQAIHSVDKIMWAFGDQPPLTAVGSGGRVRPNHEGNIFDHFQVAYEFPNGIHAHMCSRQIPGCFGENADYIYGTKGVLFIGTGRGAAAIEDLKGNKVWRYRGKGDPSMYDIEHVELFQSIRAGKPINDGDRMATSTMAGIFGRMACYTGDKIAWDQAVESKQDLAPDIASFDDKVDADPLPVPGVTKFV